MPAISLIFHLHHPFLPGRLSYGEWTNHPAFRDVAATRSSLETYCDQVLDPLAELLQVLAAEDLQETAGVGVTISGELLDQWQRWRPASLERWQRLAARELVEVLPQPLRSIPDILWDREAWKEGLNSYRDQASLLGLQVSPVAWQPGYLFLPYLAWPLRSMGIRAVLVDGDSLQWQGKWSHRLGQVAYQRDISLLVRDSGWSRHWLSSWTEGVGSPSDRMRYWLSQLRACGNEPIVLGLDTRAWTLHPGALPMMLTGLRQLLQAGLASEGLAWLRPHGLLNWYPERSEAAGEDWWVAPESAALLGRAGHPLAAEVLTHWRGLTPVGATLDPMLIDAAHLCAMDEVAGYQPQGLRGGDLYGRLIRALALIELQQRAGTDFAPIHNATNPGI